MGSYVMPDCGGKPWRCCSCASRLLRSCAGSWWTRRSRKTVPPVGTVQSDGTVVVACPACPPLNRHVAHTCGRGTKKTATNTKTGYKGVSYKDGKFSAHIRQGGTKRPIGSFSSAAEAALAYARAAATVPAAQPVAVANAEARAEPEAPQQPLQPLGKRVPKRKRVFESLESADPPEVPQNQLPLRQREVAGPGPPRPLRCTIETPCAACLGRAN